MDLNLSNDFGLIDHAETAGRMRWHRLTCEGLTQAEYAERANLSRSQYSNWESAKQRLSLSGAMQLRKTYKLSLDFLFCGTVETLPPNLIRQWYDTHENSL